MAICNQSVYISALQLAGGETNEMLWSIDVHLARLDSLVSWNISLEAIWEMHHDETNAFTLQKALGIVMQHTFMCAVIIFDLMHTI